MEDFDDRRLPGRTAIMVLFIGRIPCPSLQRDWLASVFDGNEFWGTFSPGNRNIPKITNLKIN